MMLTLFLALFLLHNQSYLALFPICHSIQQYDTCHIVPMPFYFVASMFLHWLCTPLRSCNVAFYSDKVFRFTYIYSLVVFVVVFFFF